MFLIILSAIGILLLFLGSELGLLLIAPGIIAIIINIVKALNEHAERARREAETKERERAQKQAEEEEKQKILQQQHSLTERYKTSALTKKVIRVISAGEPFVRFPEEIIIADTYIQGKVGRETYTFDFAANQVVNFEQASCLAYREDELKYKVVRPQLAMADALNTLLDDKYVIHDHANRQYHDRQDCDGDWYSFFIYNSDHTTMVLKSTLPNKHF